MSSLNKSFGLIIWLILLAFMVILMMQIGAITRLSLSGLSMVEWRPFMGFLPPLTDIEWQRVFALYQETSQYKLQNFNMLLPEFKQIFWWEYIHRLFGRLIGLTFLIPFLWFHFSKKIPKEEYPSLLFLFFLGGLQGAIGWWMVASGFVDRTEVSHIRLLVHLSIAFLILGLIIWQILKLCFPNPTKEVCPLPLPIKIVFGLVIVTLLTGVLVAGLGAGLSYNSWPLMHGKFIPELYGALQPWYINPTDNPAAVQFNHRTIAVVTVLSAVISCLWLINKHPSKFVQWSAFLLMTSLFAQMLIGIFTLLLEVPIILATIHQLGAIAAFSLAVILTYGIRYK